MKTDNERLRLAIAAGIDELAAGDFDEIDEADLEAFIATLAAAKKDAAA